MANPLALITSLANGKSSISNEFKGVVKRDWVPTGRIDFATKLESNADPDQPSDFKLLVEERRIIESIAGNVVMPVCVLISMDRLPAPFSHPTLKFGTVEQSVTA